MPTRHETRVVAGKLVCLSIAVAILASGIVSRAETSGPAGPPLLSYPDLVNLYENALLAPELNAKLAEILNTPFVSNSGSAFSLRAAGRTGAAERDFIRVAMWNIERGLEFDALKASLRNDEEFFRKLHQSDSGSKTNLKTVLDQARWLNQADVVVLNEVDWGLKRTGYRNVAKDLAASVGMNYAYAVEFVEVDPITLGIELLEGETAADKDELVKNIAVDNTRTRGLHGTAILSRFPLRNVRIVRFVNQGHDWYTDEKKGVTKLEAGMRKAAGLVFEEKIVREVRRGGRMMLLADIEDAALPGGKMTIVATHLEAMTKPANRLKQLEEVLAQVKDIPHPVILAGDMNTSGSDSTPTSFQREVKKRMGSTSFWVGQGIKYATGVGLIYDVTLGAVKYQRTRKDPTVKSIKFVSENPEEKFFTTLKNYRFADGGAFDFRGTKEYSLGGNHGTLSNSNERSDKGFVSTWEMKGKITIPFKLDWLFVKPADLREPGDNAESHQFAPRYGRTLKALNYSLKDRISDHNPITVDLPLAGAP